MLEKRVNERKVSDVSEIVLTGETGLHSSETAALGVG